MVLSVLFFETPITCHCDKVRIKLIPFNRSVWRNLQNFMELLFKCSRNRYRVAVTTDHIFMRYIQVARLFMRLIRVG